MHSKVCINFMSRHSIVVLSMGTPESLISITLQVHTKYLLQNTEIAVLAHNSICARSLALCDQQCICLAGCNSYLSAVQLHCLHHLPKATVGRLRSHGELSVVGSGETYIYQVNFKLKSSISWRVISAVGELSVNVLGGSAVYLEARMDSVGGCFKCCRYLIESKFW